MKVIPRQVRFFATAAGAIPAKEFILSLPKSERKIVGGDINAAQWSNPWKKPIVGFLGKGLWEVRTTLPNTISRIIFFEYEGVMILLHGFKKTTQKTPAEIIKIALTRKKLYENQK